MNGKYAHQVELNEAVATFWFEWMPYVTPGHEDQAWSEFKAGMHDTGWISNWQQKKWLCPVYHKDGTWSVTK
jgi:hypothetical protein